MPVGICKLCLKTAKLQNSHLIPSAMYKYIYEQSLENGTPVLIQKRKTSPVIRQVRDYLLCEDCEIRFNKNGENWMTKWVWNGKSFPMLNRLNVAHPHRTLPELIEFSGPAVGIDTEQLAYFALSILWRMGVHEWRTSMYTTETISLSPYEETIRKFLHGETIYPTSVVVNATICTDIPSWKQFYLPTPARFNLPVPISAFSFLLLGIHFLIFLGDPGPIDKCCVQSPARSIFQRDCSRKTREAHEYLKA